jgi:signal peptidase I
MKLLSKSTGGYIAAIVILILVAYFIQTDTRRVDGTSMLPTLQGGDLVVVQPVAFNDLKVGDIIVYNDLCSTQGESVIHRVVKIESAGLITQGDNNPGTDQASQIAVGPITSQCVVGKVVFVVPYVELVAYWIDQHQLPPWFSYVPVALILAIVVYLLLGDKPSEKTETEGGETKVDGDPAGKD